MVVGTGFGGGTGAFNASTGDDAATGGFSAGRMEDEGESAMGVEAETGAADEGGGGRGSACTAVMDADEDAPEESGTSGACSTAPDGADDA